MTDYSFGLQKFNNSYDKIRTHNKHQHLGALNKFRLLNFQKSYFRLACESKKLYPPLRFSANIPPTTENL